MIYIHIPFCKSFCTYCAFYSERSERYEAFTKALLEEARQRKSEIADAGEVNTLYIGGGTPSVLPLPLFQEIVGALGEGHYDEFTVELNPDDVLRRGPSYAESLLRAGVTRASLGVQSFDDGILRWMNRRHNAETAVEAYRTLERAGFQNISIDLIFGLPQSLLSREKWSETIDRALSISSSGSLPRHISAYQLSVEEDSALEEMIRRGDVAEAEGEECAEQYDRLCSTLAEAGYNHYEISNFAQPGFEARHNSAYWKHIPYVGLGPGAHSLRRLPGGGYQRVWNEANLEGYISSLCGGEIPGGGEVLTREQIDIENVMLGLRTSSGCSLEVLRASCNPESLSEEIRSEHLVPVGEAVKEATNLAPAGLAEDIPEDIGRARNETYYRIPEKYFFISDNIIQRLIS